MIGSKDLRVGMTVLFKGEPHRVLFVQHTAPGKGAAFVQTKMRNAKTGLQTEHKFRSSESIERVVLRKNEVQFLYREGEIFHFMNTENYEQFPLNESQLGDSVDLLLPNAKLFLEMYEDQPIGVELPSPVCLKIVKTEPMVKTATVQAHKKPAIVESGATIQVPGFISEGEWVEIDPNTREYLGRAKEPQE